MVGHTSRKFPDPDAAPVALSLIIASDTTKRMFCPTLAIVMVVRSERAATTTASGVDAIVVTVWPSS